MSLPPSLPLAQSDIQLARSRTTAAAGAGTGACSKAAQGIGRQEHCEQTCGAAHLYTAGFGGGVSVACRKLSASVPTKTATSVRAKWL